MIEIKPGDIVIVRGSWREAVALVEKVTAKTFQGREWNGWGKTGWSEYLNRRDIGSVIGVALSDDPQATVDALRHSNDRRDEARRQAEEQHKARITKLLKPTGEAA